MRPISRVEIAEIQALIVDHPQWRRRRLSVVLAQRWPWLAPSGQFKDMAARTLLLKLQDRGLMGLPERRRAPPGRRPACNPDRFEAVLPDAPVKDIYLYHLGSDGHRHLGR